MIIRVFIMFVLLVFSSCSKDRNQDPAVSPLDESIPVEVIRVEKRSATRTLELSGNIEAWKSANLGGELAGKIERIYVEEGDDVEKGALLVQMTDENLIKAKAQFLAVEKDWKRMNNLLQKKTITKQAFDRIKAEYDVAKAGLETVQNSTRILAPFSGTVTKKYLEEGEVYTLFPGDAGSPAILELMQLNPVKLIIAVTEKDLPVVNTNLAAEITVDSYPERVFKGMVFRINPTVNKKTRTSEVEIKADNADRDFKPGMFARVKLVLGQSEGLYVPQEAVLKQLGTGILYVLTVEEQKAVRKNVETGLQMENLIEIMEGLLGDEMIVVSGQTRLSTGMQVQIIEGGAEK